MVDGLVRLALRSTTHHNKFDVSLVIIYYLFVAEKAIGLRAN